MDVFRQPRMLLPEPGLQQRVEVEAVNRAKHCKGAAVAALGDSVPMKDVFGCQEGRICFPVPLQSCLVVKSSSERKSSR